MNVWWFLARDLESYHKCRVMNRNASWLSAKDSSNISLANRNRRVRYECVYIEKLHYSENIFSMRNCYERKYVFIYCKKQVSNISFGSSYHERTYLKTNAKSNSFTSKATLKKRVGRIMKNICRWDKTWKKKQMWEKEEIFFFFFWLLKAIRVSSILYVNFVTFPYLSKHFHHNRVVIYICIASTYQQADAAIVRHSSRKTDSYNEHYST